MSKRAFCYIITAFLLVFSVAVLLKTRPVSNAKILFDIRSDGGIETISAWDSKDVNYVFLPSYAEIDNIFLSERAEESFYIDGKTIRAGEKLPKLNLDTEYQIESKNNSSKIVFTHSDNIDTLYVDTITGSTDHVNKDKSYKEDMEIRYYDKTGKLKGHIENGHIKGRGNGTWLTSKKPYAIKFDQNTNVFDLGEGDEWALLSNANDFTNLRNLIIYNIASEAGMHSPRCKLVDLYLNGEYNGVYLLTEKPETVVNELVAQNRGYLFLLDSYYDKYKYRFMTDHNQPIAIKYPANCSDDDVTLLEQRIQDIENAIMSSDGIDPYTGKSYTELIDMQSWVKKYLIEELSGNTDAGRNSQYYYWSPEVDNKVFAGPVWDYDLSFGCSKHDVVKNPYYFVGRRTLTRSDGEELCWFNALYQKSEFYECVVKEYKDCFLPIMKEYEEHKVDELVADTKAASAMNYIRWRDDPSLWKSDGAEQIKSYIREHTDFLSNAWLQGKEYCTIIFDDTNNPRYNSNHFYYYYTVEKDTVWSDMPSNKALGMPDDVVWYDKKTDKVVNTETMISEDMVLYVKNINGSKRMNISAQMMKALLIAAPVVLFVIMLLAFIIVDVKRTRPQRRRK